MQHIKDEMAYWGLRGFTRFLKVIGDASELFWQTADKASNRFWASASRPLNRFNYRIGH